MAIGAVAGPAIALGVLTVAGQFVDSEPCTASDCDSPVGLAVLLIGGSIPGRNRGRLDRGNPAPGKVAVGIHQTHTRPRRWRPVCWLGRGNTIPESLTAKPNN